MGDMASMYGYGPELQCCDAVVDPLSLLGTIGAITALSLFLRQAVIDNNITGGKKRKKRNTIIVAPTMYAIVRNLVRGESCTS